MASFLADHGISISINIDEIQWNDGIEFMMGSRFLESTSNETDTVHTQMNGKTIVDSLIAYGSFFLVCFPIYCFVRLRYPHVYAIRQWSPYCKSSLASNQFGYISWLWKVYSFSQEELLEGIGLDAVCFIRILNMGFRLACVGCFNSIWLFPVYMTSEQDPDIPVNDDVKEVSVNTMRPGDTRFIATVVAAYIFFGYTFYTIFNEFRWFITQRHLWLRQFNPRNYSILVRNIPKEMRSDEALMKHFQSLYGVEKVLVAHVCLYVSDLENLVTKRKGCIANLEHALAEFAIHGKRPRHKLLMVTLGNFSAHSNQPKNEVQIVTLASSNTNPPDSSSEVDSIEYYTSEFDSLNNEINKKIDEIEGKEEHRELENHHMSTQDISSTGGSSLNISAGAIVTACISDGDVIAASDESKGADALHESFDEQSKRLIEGPPTNTIWTSNQVSLAGTSQVGTSGPETVPTITKTDAPESASIRKDVVGTIRRSMLDTKESVKGFILVAGGTSEDERRAALTGAKNARAASAGFVTFTSLVAAQGALQMSHHPDTYVFEVEPAPDERENIFWTNVRKDFRVVHTGSHISVILTIIVCLFWTFVVTFIVNLTNVEYVKNDAPESVLKSLEENPWLDDFLALLSPLLLITFDQALLPVIIESITRFEFPASDSLFKASIFLKLAVFTVIQTFFVSLISGSILQAVGNIFESPKDFVALLARALPDQSAYFMQLMIASTCVTTLLELFRVSPLLYAALRSCIGRNLTEKERTKSLGLLRPLSNVTLIYFNRTQASFLLHFMVMFVYSAISPLVNWFCFFFFLMLRSVYRHEFIFNLPSTPDSGGQNWIHFMRILLICIFISQLTLMGFLTLKEFAISIPLMAPLLVITCLCTLYLHQRHFSKGQYLAGSTCAQQDAENDEEGVDFTAFRDEYKNPAMLSRYVEVDWDSGRQERGQRHDEEHQST